MANPTTVDADSVSQRAVGGSDFGHDWEGVARDDAAGMAVQTGTLGFNNGSVGYTSDYRFLALRGPLMLQSWGYDLQGFPVPNSADSSQQPNTTYENLTKPLLDYYSKSGLLKNIGGENKIEEIKKKFGHRQVQIWRRSFESPPAQM